MGQKYHIYIHTIENSGFTKGYGIVQTTTRTIAENPEFDFWVPVTLFQSGSLYEYVDVRKDNTIEKIERQEINPFYLEYGFFDGIIRNRINNGEELTPAQQNFIRSVRPETAFLSSQDMVVWFNGTGKNQLPWTAADGTETTLGDIENAQRNIVNIFSKAEVLNIQINS